MNSQTDMHVFSPSRQNLGLLALLLTLLSFAPGAQAGVHFTLQSSISDNNLGLQSQNSRSASASIAIDLGTYFRIGLTHRQAFNREEGYAANLEKQVYEYKMEKSHIITNSLDFTLILYYGEILVPYLQAGLLVKELYLANQDNPEPQKIGPVGPMPYGGAGLGIRLNRNFSLKLSYSLSPGTKQTHPALEKESVWDSYTSIGISYSI